MRSLPRQSYDNRLPDTAAGAADNGNFSLQWRHTFEGPEVRFAPNQNTRAEPEYTGASVNTMRLSGLPF